MLEKYQLHRLGRIHRGMDNIYFMHLGLESSFPLLLPSSRLTLTLEVSILMYYWLRLQQKMVLILGKLMVNQLTALTKWCEQQTPPETKTQSETTGSLSQINLQMSSELKDGCLLMHGRPSKGKEGTTAPTPLVHTSSRSGFQRNLRKS